jgi:hypothetical protein
VTTELVDSDPPTGPSSSLLIEEDLLVGQKPNVANVSLNQFFSNYGVCFNSLRLTLIYG